MRRKRSTTFLLILLVLALLLGIAVSVLLQNAISSSSFTLPETQAAQATPEPARETITPTPFVPQSYVISMVGDCTLASSQYNSDYDSVLRNHDLSWPFSGTRSYFADDEFTLANLECAFSDQRLTSSALFYFQGPSENAEILVNGGVECVTLGNNHTYDFGEQGLLDTESALDNAGVSWVGPGDAQVFTTEHGLRIGVYCPGWTGLSENNIKTGIAALQEAGADILIFAPHWGTEGSYQVTSSQESFAHIAIDAGANIVFGTHPHVLQRIEEYNGGYIFYSLGNWSFGGNTAPRDRDTAIAQVTVTEQKDGSYVLDGYACIPCCLSSTDGVNDYRPTPYDEDSEEYRRVMNKLDGVFTGPDLSVDYS